MTELGFRLQALEEKFEYQDQLLDTLNEVIITQQSQIDSLEYEIKKLRADMHAMIADQKEHGVEKPPHY